MIVIKYMLYSHLFQNTPAGTRTRNLPLRRRMPYPLGHGSLYITLYISSLHNNRNGKKTSQLGGSNSRPPAYEAGALPLS